MSGDDVALLIIKQIKHSIKPEIGIYRIAYLRITQLELQKNS
jgi:hypothetical protein